MISLTSWVLSPDINEIVIVDWSSDKPIDHLCGLSSRIKVVRVDDQKYYNLSKSFNLAADVSTGNILLKLDCDVVLNPYFNIIKENPLEYNTFYTGHWKMFPKYYHPLNGFLYIRRNDFFKVNGYNEYLEGYGYDDEDIYNRLQDAGVNRNILPALQTGFTADFSQINQQTGMPLLNGEIYVLRTPNIFHIPHNDDERVKEYPIDNVFDSHAENERIAKSKKYDKRICSWDIEQVSDQYYTAKMV